MAKFAYSFGIIIFGLALGYILQILVNRKRIKLPPEKTGALYGCGSFTNIGSIGALICFIFIGENGLAGDRAANPAYHHRSNIADCMMTPKNPLPTPSKQHQLINLLK